MTRLYLVRHGIAVPYGTPGIADDDRPLTDEGEKRMKQVAKGLRRLGVQPDRIITSPLPRARRTAEIVADVLDLESALEVADLLRAGNSAEVIRDWLNSRSEENLMLVGHDPAFSDLVGLLVTGQLGPLLCQLRKGGVASFSTDPSGGGLLLDWLARPRMLRRL